jgi:chromosome segregation ATPase
VVRTPDSKPSGLSRFVHFLGRLILAFLKLLPVFIIVIALLAAAWLGYQELNRSFGIVNDRVDWNDEQMTQLQGELSTVSTSLAIQQSQQSELAANTAQVDGRISAVNDNLTRQNDLLAALEEQVAALETSADSSVENITALGEGFNALQNDVMANGAQIDTLGGQIDGLGVDANTLRGDIAANSEALAQKEATVAQLSKTLTLFRIWETVARARLRLVDENIGLAQADIETAQSILEQMAAEETGDLADALQQMQTRLSLAANDLPDDPEAAVRDLNTVWEALDTALTMMLEEVSQTEPTIEGK